MKLRDYLRKAKDIVFESVTGISNDNVQDAVKTAYDKGNQALTVANGKLDQATADGRYLGIAAKAVDADKLDGKDSTDYVLVVNISTVTNSTSTTQVSAAVATKTAYDHATSAHNLIASKDTEYNGKFEKLTNRNVVNGYAGLDSAGLISPNQIPGQTIVNVETYASTTERNADTTVEKGDMSIIEMSGKASLYILKIDPAGTATTDADWLTLQTNVTIDVNSWNGRNGSVMPAIGDYTTALILHGEDTLSSFLTNLQASIPATPGDLDAYSKTEADGRFINKSAISDSVTSTSTTNVANSKAAKTAYDQGTTALNTANGKLSQDDADKLYLAINGKAADANLLDGHDSAYFLNTTGKAADADKLDGQHGSFYQNASNLNAGTIPNAQLPATALRSDSQIKDIAGQLAAGTQTRISVDYDTANKVYNFNAAVQSDNNFTSAYKSKLDNLANNQWSVINNHITVKTGDRIILDMTSIGTIIVTLPPTPKAGDAVMVADGTGLAGQGKTITIDRNDQKIMSLAEDLNFDIPGYLTTLVFLNPVRGWVVLN